MSLVIGIEAIGIRQSVVVASDELGNLVGSYRLVGEPLSLHAMDRSLLRTRLSTLLREVARISDRTLNDLADARICVGMSGVTFPFDSEQDLKEEFSRLEVKIESLCCTGDAEIVLASHAGSCEGSVILCNVDAQMYVATAERSVKYGGFGPALGDDGSGYWIGKKALRSVADELSAGADPTPFWKRLDHWLVTAGSRDYPDWQAASIEWRRRRQRYLDAARGYDLRTALIAYANDLSVRQHATWRSIIAGLVIPVMAAWQDGDLTADRIVRSAAQRLAQQFRRACEMAGTAHAVSPVVLYGGVLSHHPKFIRLVADEIAGLMTKPEHFLTAFDVGTMRPACGALLFALGGSTTGNLRLPVPSVIERLRTGHARAHREGKLKND